MVTTLLLYGVGGSSDGSSSSDGAKAEVAGLEAAAADALSAMLTRYKKQPATEAVAAILAEQAQVELVQQALRQAVLHGAGDNAGIRGVRRLAQVLQCVCATSRLQQCSHSWHLSCKSFLS
jgi:hypothetical protein